MAVNRSTINPRVSLRIFMLLVTIVCIGLAWVGWQGRIVAQRQMIARTLEKQGTGLVNGHRIGFHYRVVAHGDKSQRISWFQELLGDKNAETIVFEKLHSEQRAIIQAFPEADILINVTRELVER